MRALHPFAWIVAALALWPATSSAQTPTAPPAIPGAPAGTCDAFAALKNVSVDGSPTAIDTASHGIALAKQPASVIVTLSAGATVTMVSNSDTVTSAPTAGDVALTLGKGMYHQFHVALSQGGQTCTDDGAFIVLANWDQALTLAGTVSNGLSVSAKGSLGQAQFSFSPSGAASISADLGASPVLHVDAVGPIGNPVQIQHLSIRTALGTLFDVPIGAGGNTMTSCSAFGDVVVPNLAGAVIRIGPAKLALSNLALTCGAQPSLSGAASLGFDADWTSWQQSGTFQFSPGHAPSLSLSAPPNLGFASLPIALDQIDRGLTWSDDGLTFSGRLRLTDSAAQSEASLKLNISKAGVGIAPPATLYAAGYRLDITRFTCSQPKQLAGCAGDLTLSPPPHGGITTIAPLSVSYAAGTYTISGPKQLQLGSVTLTFKDQPPSRITLTSRKHSIAGSGTLAIANVAEKVLFDDLAIEETAPINGRSTDWQRTIAGSLRFSKDADFGVFKLTGLKGNFKTADDHTALVLTFDGLMAGNVGTVVQDFKASVSQVVLNVPLDGSDPAFDTSHSLVKASGTFLGRKLDGGCAASADGRMAHPLFEQPAAKQYAFCVGLHLNPTGTPSSKDLMNARIVIGYTGKKIDDVEEAAVWTEPGAKLHAHLGSRAFDVTDVDLSYTKVATIGYDWFKPDERAESTPLCPLNFRGSMTISADGIIPGSGATPLTPSLGFGDRCMVGEIQGMVHLDLTQNTSAVLQQVRFAHAPSPSATALSKSQYINMVDVKGDIYIQSVVINFDRIGFRHDDANPSRNAIWAKPNPAATVTNTALKNLNGIITFVTGIITRGVFK